MSTNPYFRSHTAAATNEQLLLEDLICESVSISGIDIYYIPRESDIDLNSLMGEQPDTRFTDVYPIECYLVNFDGYDGQNEFMSKFGLEIRSSTNVVITRRSFKRHVGIFEYPREGDLLYIPVLERLFEIKHSDPDINYHQLGRKASKPFYWELRLEQFKYSQENIDTGIDGIDLVGVLNSYTIQLNMGSGIGNYIIGEEVYQGNNYLLATSTAKVSDWNPTDKILSIINIRNTMNANSEVIGVTSNTRYTLSAYDNLEDHVPDDMSTNDGFDDEGDVIIDLSETNPLGYL